jgi:hypothetical protein
MAKPCSRPRATPTAAFVCVLLAVLAAQSLPKADAGRLLLQSGNITTSPPVDLSSDIEGSLLVGDGEQLGKVGRSYNFSLLRLVVFLFMFPVDEVFTQLNQWHVQRQASN